jgi:LmbE family N-acetylglucosaminyl deacetylase
MLELQKNSKIMIVVAHPDDEVLGLGATLHKLIHEKSAIVHVVILGEGITSRSEKRDIEVWQKELEKHKQNIHSAKQIIGYQSLSLYSFPDNRFDSVPLLDIIKSIESEKNKFKPDIVFTHHFGDLNIDHQRTFDAVMTAFRPLPEESKVSILTFETPSSTEWQVNSDGKRFNPNIYIEISEQNLKAKIDAMECFEFEKRKYPHPRSPEGLKILAQHNGINVGIEYAEAFCIIRHIER